MKLKRFENFKVNEDYKEKSFYENMKEDFDMLDVVKTILSLKFDHGFEVKATNEDEFREWMSDVNIDATYLLDLSLDQEIDLCIYAEDTAGFTLGDAIDAEKRKGDKISWDDLVGIINNASIGAAGVYYEDVIGKLVDEINDFIEENDLEYSQMKAEDPFGRYASKGIVDGVTQYRGLDNTPDANYDVYHFHSKVFDLDLYFSKKV